MRTTKKLIQIRGANATGKTTIVRQFIQRHNLSMSYIEIGGVTTPLNVSDDGSIVVLGRYDKSTGGCDLFKNKAHVVATIKYSVKRYAPKVIIFEGFIYGKTFSFAFQLNQLCKLLGYEFKAIVLRRRFERTLELITERNGGKPFSIENLKHTVRDVSESAKKLKAAGIKTKVVDADLLPFNDMYTILEEEI